MSNNKQIQILKTSEKGAKLITDGTKVSWAMPRQVRADGSITPAAQAALENSNFTYENYLKSENNKKEESEAGKPKYLILSVVKSDEVETKYGTRILVKFYNCTAQKDMWLNPKQAFSCGADGEYVKIFTEYAEWLQENKGFDFSAHLEENLIYDTNSSAMRCRAN